MGTSARLISYQPKDYFNNQNPNSHWSFGFTEPNDHLSFQLYPNYVDNFYGQSEFSNLQHPSMSGFSLWYERDTSSGAPYYNKGVVGMNSRKDTNIVYGTEFELKPGQIIFHPGINNTHACIRFTVPSAGFYDVEGIFFSPGPASNPNGCASTDVHLSINNVELRSLWINQNSGMLIFRQIYLNMGDYVQFEVGWGKNKNITCDTTAANITITSYN